MSVNLPGGVSLPAFWTAYAAMGGVAAALAALWLAVPRVRRSGALAALIGWLPLLHAGVLALAVRREGLEPVSALQAARFPAVPLYAGIIVPLAVSVSAAVLTGSFSADEAGGGRCTVEGLHQNVRRRYVRAQDFRSFVTWIVSLVLLTLLALDIEAPQVTAVLLSLSACVWLLPPFLRLVYRRELAAMEQQEAPSELVAQARALAEQVRAASVSSDVPLERVVVDVSPSGWQYASARDRDGALALSWKLLDVTEPAERDFLIRRELEFAADRAGRATARRWYMVAWAFILSPLLAAPLFTASVTAGGILLLLTTGLLAPLGVLSWLFVARPLAVKTRLRAASRALDATRNAEAALSAVRKVGNPLEDPAAALRIFYEPPPTEKEQARALRAEAAQLGLPLPPEPPHRGGLNLGIPFHRG